MDFVVGEDFELTPAIKLEVEDKVNSIREHLRKEPPISVFLSKEGPNEFKVQMKFHAEKKDFFATETHEDFYVALNAVRNQLIRQVDDHNKRRIHERNNNKEKWK